MKRQLTPTRTTFLTAEAIGMIGVVGNIYEGERYDREQINSTAIYGYRRDIYMYIISLLLEQL